MGGDSGTRRGPILSAMSAIVLVMAYAVMDSWCRLGARGPSSDRAGVTEAATPARAPMGVGETSDRPVHCGRCATSFDVGAWLALPVVAVLAGDAIVIHVVKWPQGVRIEIRRCPRCGGSIARTNERRRISTK